MVILGSELGDNCAVEVRLGPRGHCLEVDFGVRGGLFLCFGVFLKAMLTLSSMKLSYLYLGLNISHFKGKSGMWIEFS